MDEYQLYYWPGIPGRGEFVRLALEAAAVPYRDVGREQGFEAVAEFAGVTGASVSSMPFAPPYLRVDGLTIFQTANICAYIGERHALAPDDEQGRLFALGLAMTVEDCAREAHDTHHPISVNLYYEEQQDAAQRRAEDFRNDRLGKFLGYFDRVLSTNPVGSDWLVRAQMSYADLSLFQLVEGLRHAFPRAMARQEPGFPRLVALASRISQHERISSYLHSDRRCPFNNQGLFRYYPELDA